MRGPGDQFRGDVAEMLNYLEEAENPEVSL